LGHLNGDGTSIQTWNDSTAAGGLTTCDVTMTSKDSAFVYNSEDIKGGTSCLSPTDTLLVRVDIVAIQSTLENHALRDEEIRIQDVVSSGIHIHCLEHILIDLVISSSATSDYTDWQYSGTTHT
jgi:hypothetical protein